MFGEIGPRLMSFVSAAISNLVVVTNPQGPSTGAANCVPYLDAKSRPTVSQNLVFDGIALTTRGIASSNNILRFNVGANVRGSGIPAIEGGVAQGITGQVGLSSTINFCSSSGAAFCNLSGSTQYLQIAQNSISVNAISDATGTIVVAVDGVASQTGDLLQFRNNSHAVLSRVTSAGWIQNTQGRARNTADATNATATMANLSDLSITLIAGRKYTGFLTLFANNSTAGEGLAFDFNGGTATMTSFEAGFSAQPPGVTLGTLTTTSLSTALTATTATTADAVYTIEVTINCNVGGTFILRFAEAIAHVAGTATVRLGSYVWLEDTP